VAKKICRKVFIPEKTGSPFNDFILARKLTKFVTLFCKTARILRLFCRNLRLKAISVTVFADFLLIF